MTAPVTDLAPIDRCPACPGDNPACLPLAYMDLPYGTIAAYWHRSCDTAWATFSDEFGWPVDRSVAPPLDAATGRAA